MNFPDQHSNDPPGLINPRNNTPPGQYTYQGTTIKKVLDKNEACIPCRRRKTKCDVSFGIPVGLATVTYTARHSRTGFDAVRFLVGLSPFSDLCLGTAAGMWDVLSAGSGMYIC